MQTSLQSGTCQRRDLKSPEFIYTLMLLRCSDTPRPVERDGLLSNGGSMTVFPKKPYSVGGCTIYLTQTTEYQSTQGRACPTTTSQKRTSGCVDTFSEFLVGDSSPRTFSFHQRRSGQVRANRSGRRNAPVPCLCEGAGQGAGLLPSSARPPRLSASALLVYSQWGQGNRKSPVPNPMLRNGAFIPIRLLGTGLPAPVG